MRASKAVHEVVRNRTEISVQTFGYDAELATYRDAGLYSSVGAEIDEPQCDDIQGAFVAFARKSDLGPGGTGLYEHHRLAECYQSSHSGIIRDPRCYHGPLHVAVCSDCCPKSSMALKFSKV